MFHKTGEREMTELALEVNLQQIETAATDITAILNGKGYNDVTFELEYAPVLDTITVNLVCYTQDWGSIRPDSGIRTSNRHGATALLQGLRTWAEELPHEHVERDNKLLRDFAHVKERIAASSLSDLVKAEATALMVLMTENILPAPKDTAGGK